jgi:hypothetical protein
MDFNMWLQSRLTAHGFAVGPIDGDIGVKTLAALAAFQFARGLKQTGKADPATEAALRLSSSAIAPAVKAALPIDRDLAPAKEAFQPSRRIWPRQAEVPGFYGAVGQNQVAIEVPFDMCLAWSKSTRLRRMTLHRLVADSALHALQSIAIAYSAKERHDLGIDLFGGSLNVRRMRGGSAYSMHSWGIAIDFDPERNHLDWGANRARLAQADAVRFWVAWESAGWLSLGRARNFDWMHIQAARL